MSRPAAFGVLLVLLISGFGLGSASKDPEVRLGIVDSGSREPRHANGAELGVVHNWIGDC